MKKFIFTLSVDENAPRLYLTETESGTANEYAMIKNDRDEFTMVGRDKKLLFQTFFQEIMPKETRALLFDPFSLLEPEKTVNTPEPEDEEDWCETPDDDWLTELEANAPDTADADYAAEIEDDECPPLPTEKDAPSWAFQEINDSLSFAQQRLLRLEIARRLEDDFGISAESASAIVDAGIFTLRGFAPDQITDDLIDAAVEEAVDEILDKGFGMGDIALKKEIEKEFAFPEQGAVTVYTDGSCLQDSGAGGWAAVIRCKGHKKELSGGAKDTTSSRMELMAVLKALEFLNGNHQITLFSDSKYVVDGINKGTAYSWKQCGWKKSDNSPEPNVDLWERLLTLLEQRQVTVCWVKGHKGVPDNERCDQLASYAAVCCECTK